MVSLFCLVGLWGVFFLFLFFRLWLFGLCFGGVVFVLFVVCCFVGYFCFGLIGGIGGGVGFLCWWMF